MALGVAKGSWTPAAGNGRRLSPELAHFGVAGGLGGTSSPVVVQDSATDAVTDNGIAMCLHIIYDCAGEGAGPPAGIGCMTSLGLAQPPDDGMSADVAGLTWPSTSAFWPTRCP